MKDKTYTVKIRFIDNTISCCSQMCTNECPFFDTCPSYEIQVLPKGKVGDADGDA